MLSVNQFMKVNIAKNVVSWTSNFDERIMNWYIWVKQKHFPYHLTGGSTEQCLHGIVQDDKRSINHQLWTKTDTYRWKKTAVPLVLKGSVEETMDG